jgi:peptide-methionine (S)-S-oxide reductase
MLAIVGSTSRGAAERGIRSGTVTQNTSAELENVVFAGGCFWGVQAVFQHVKGVEIATSGYAGGAAATATYPQTSTGRTGHAESVRVVYDPERVSFEQLLEVFFSVAHDPTQLNRQGPDVGPQYRSAVWTTSAEQAGAVRAFIEKLDRSGGYARPIVTEIAPLEAFYPAEEYHQDYLIRHPNSPYIRIHDMPKLEALRDQYPKLWRDETAPWEAASS